MERWAAVGDEAGKSEDEDDNENDAVLLRYRITHRGPYRPVMLS
jgi:hypothetical protein